MPIGRGNFNKRRVNATKERKVKERVAKKLQASKQKHNSKKVAVSGQRTGVFTEREQCSSLCRSRAHMTICSCAGKAKKKIELAQKKSLRKAIASGAVDLEMADACRCQVPPDQHEKADN